jgi:hypothetical protein
MRKQFMDARITALHLPSLKIAQSSHSPGNCQAWHPETSPLEFGHIEYDDAWPTLWIRKGMSLGNGQR